ncbi:MAG: hypothetical protein ACREK1_11750 [Longimicrobiales bacterium]
MDAGIGNAGAVLYDIGRQPRAARDFFIRYQDRILFGKDSFQPQEYPYYWRVFETQDDYFDYYPARRNPQRVPIVGLRRRGGSR